MVNKKLSKENILSLPQLYNEGLSILILGDRFKVHPTTIWRHLKKQNIEIRDSSSSAKIAIKFNRSKINKIPNNLKFDEDLSYILGVLAGDGFIDYSDSRMTWQIGLNAVDKDFVNEFGKVLYNFFKINPTFNSRGSKNKNWKSQVMVRLCSKEACNYINQIGDFKKNNWRIPKFIKKSDDRVKCAFLKGFFDSEGEIDKQIGRVGATSMNLEGLNEMTNLLNDLGIRNTVIKKKDNRPNTHQKYVLRINDKNSIKSFYELIGFTIKRKQDILSDFVMKKFC